MIFCKVAPPKIPALGCWISTRRHTIALLVMAVVSPAYNVVGTPTTLFLPHHRAFKEPFRSMPRPTGALIEFPSILILELRVSVVLTQAALTLKKSMFLIKTSNCNGDITVRIGYAPAGSVCRVRSDANRCNSSRFSLVVIVRIANYDSSA